MLQWTPYGTILERERERERVIEEMINTMNDHIIS